MNGGHSRGGTDEKRAAEEAQWRNDGANYAGVGHPRQLFGTEARTILDGANNGAGSNQQRDCTYRNKWKGTLEIESRMVLSA